MFETLSIVPFSFWVVLALLAAGFLWASGQIRNGIGLPIIAVLATVAVWYVGDALYNDYSGDYATNFTPAALTDAWWEVALFVAVFLVLTSMLHRWINARYLPQGSQVYRMIQTGTGQPMFQFRLDQLFWACATVWLVLTAFAVVRLGRETPYYFLPFLGHAANPWDRGRVGGGIDALLALAWNLELFVATAFGLVAALAQNRQVRSLALAGCLLTWPFYIFARARNPMLAVAVPAILAWVFLRSRGGIWQKIAILASAFLLVNAWFGFVIANRSQMSIESALEEKGFSLEQDEDVHHEGLNMFEELCWINTFLTDGTFRPPWGQEYFAELVNPVPRSLWSGKPMIGIDYAVARGQAVRNAGDTGDSAGVYATISTGMVGQGVVNFGRILGPAFAALLMSIWAAGLARLDLQGQKVGRIPLYALGIILTFNLGRDITLITLYTFVFGSAIVWWLDSQEKSGGRAPALRRGKRNARKNPRVIPAPSPFAVTSAPAVERNSSSKPQRE